MKFKNFGGIEIKANKGKREIEAYASTFGNVDFGGDIVTKGAFEKTIRERFAGGTKKLVKVLWQHNMYMPIGLPVHMEEDSKGLYTVSKISETDWGDRALALVADGVVDTMSIGYDVVKDDHDSAGNRLLNEVKLYEYSPVTFPMNGEASILGVKSQGEFARILDEFGAADLGQLFDGKAGAVLSRGNVEKIKNAIKALEDVLNVAGVEPEKSTHKSNDDEINPQELQSILSQIKVINKNMRG